MSENEKKKRLEYRRKRSKLLLIQAIIAIVIGVAIVISSVVYFRINSNFLVSYTEQSAIDYKVYLKPNNEYEEDYLGKDQSYIATLIDSVAIDFNYQIDLDSKWANYNGNYHIDAKLTIQDNSNRKAIFTHTYPLKTTTLFEHLGNNKLNIHETISVSYDEYNSFAKDFVKLYNLSNVSCYVDVAMHVESKGACAEFENTDFGSCSFSLNIPLTENTIDINMVSSNPAGKQSSISCENCVNKNTFRNLAIGLGGLEVIALLMIIIYAYATRNHDINYEIKIKRLVSAYKNYIQKILSEFCYDGYQVLKVETFTEMLDIRDTINSPILMSENLDKTCTKFLIPTDNGILYMHEIRVDDYDEIYNKAENDMLLEEQVKQEVIATVNESTATTEQAIPVEQPVAEQPMAEQPIVEETVVTAEETLEPVADSFKKDTGFDYSFISKLHLATDETRGYYKDIVSFAQSYGMKVVRSWGKERLLVGKKTYALMSFKGFKLAVAFALDPNEYADTKYKLQDVSHVRRYVSTPAQMKVTSNRKVVWVMELLEQMLKADGVSDMHLDVAVEDIVPKTREELLQEKLIKIEKK